MIKKLSNNWFLEKHIDFEYQKYILLSYLQYINYNFIVIVSEWAIIGAQAVYMATFFWDFEDIYFGDGQIRNETLGLKKNY